MSPRTTTVSKAVEVAGHEPSANEDTVIRWASRQHQDFADWNNYVLVVEDDAALRDMYRTALRTAGRVVIGASDGVEALRLIALQNPSVIVLDLALPRLDGHAVLRSLKSDPATSNIPIVVVTGTDSSRVNPNDYASLLCKPTSADQVIVAVENARRHSGPSTASR